MEISDEDDNISTKDASPKQPNKKKSLKSRKSTYSCRFNPSWKEEFPWVKEVVGKPSDVKCKLCKKVFSIASTGKNNMKRHQTSDFHKKNLEVLKSQPTLVCGPGKALEISKAKPYVIDLPLKAEILWVLKLVSSNYSFSSCDDMTAIFKEMFSDSDIAGKFQMARTKATYLLNYGIAEYLEEQLSRDAAGVTFGYSFDETTTIQKQKQYDCYLKYNSSTFKRIVTRYISSEFLGHCTADHLFQIFFNKMKLYKLDVNFMIQIGMDGPNTNKSFLSKVFSKIKTDFNKECIDVGTCCLHPVHTAFIKALHTINFDFEDLVQDLHSFFKFSACRVEDFGLMSVITEHETKNMHRHVESRWLSLGPVLSRIDDQWDNLVQYFIKEIPKDKNQKKTMESARYQRIKLVLESQTSRITINFAIFIANILENHILRPFQSKSPNIHLLYSAMGKLLYSIMINFIPQSELSGTDPITLSKVDCKVKASLYKEVNYGKKVDDLISSIGKLSLRQSLEIDKLKTEFRTCYITLVEILQKKLPIRSPFLKNAFSIDPDHKLDKSTPSALKYLAGEIGRCMKNTLKCSISEYVDRVMEEFQLYLIDNSLKTDFERLDEYWWHVKDNSNSYNNLCNLAFNVMTLSIANVPAEEGFSINKNFLDGRVQLSPKCLTSLRATKDTLLHYNGKIVDFPITNELLSTCSKAYRRYESDLKSKKDLQELEKIEYEKKRESIAKQKKQDKTDELKKQKRKLKQQLDAAKKLISMGDSKIKTGIKANNMGIVADGSSNVSEGWKRVSELEAEIKLLTSKMT